MEIFLKNWYSKFFEELSRTKSLRIISPFVKEQIIRTIYDKVKLQNVELITRFNLGDFASKISSIDALRFAVGKGASIFGIKNLHSKIYLFDERCAIVTSANLTMGGLVNNYECGIYLNNQNTIRELHKYFNDLILIGNNKLTIEQCDSWIKRLAKSEIVNTSMPALPDFGATPINIDKVRSYYVKFLGKGDDRAPLSMTTKEEIDRALCHYACGFSVKRKPRQIKENDIIYFARMTYDPWDYAIFGKAEAIQFVDGRDKATGNEIRERSWKAKYPIYLRVKNPVFVNGIMGDCVLLYDLVSALDYESFISTSEKYQKGQRDINPKDSLRQQPYVRLTLNGAEWLESRFQETVKRTGLVEEEFIKQLPQSIKIPNK